MMNFSLKEASSDSGFRMEGYWIWCPSVIKAEDGRYHMFASRWPKDLPMHPGWLVASEIVRAVSDQPEGPYIFEEVILTSRGPDYWDGRSVHNPSIIKVGDTYVLYYMGTTHPFPETTLGRKLSLEDPRVVVSRVNKRIGIATSKSIKGPWVRRDKPILEPRPGHYDNCLVSNPTPLVQGDGSILLCYKSRGYKDNLHGPHLHSNTMQFGIAVSDQYQGPYKRVSTEAIFEPDLDVEDPFIWASKDSYHMIAKDMTGDICGESGAGFYASSQDGKDWQIERGQAAYSKKVRFKDGQEKLMGNMERPFILFEEGKATHLFFATSDAEDDKGIMGCKNTWNMVIALA